VIIDYTNGFDESQLEKETLQMLRMEQHHVQFEPWPINPFRRQTTGSGNKVYEEKIFNTAQRVASVFSSVYYLGDQQKSVLYQAVREGIEEHGAEMDLTRLMEILDRYASEGPNKESAATVQSRLMPFVHGEPFGREHPESWNNFYADPDHLCHVIQLMGCPKDFSALVTEFSLVDLYWFARSTGNKDRPKVVVLDEIQNLDHSESGPLCSFLTEGRKFGLSMILATQTLQNLKPDARHRLFQASHKLFFRPAETEVQEYAKILERSTGESAEYWVKRLSSLGKGECYSLGPIADDASGELRDRALKIKITSLGERLARHQG
jgi:DNA phosphorothioation-dependent restriction protein DptH